MLKPILLSLLLVVLAACKNGQPYGNHASLSDAQNAQLVTDTVRQFIRLYPPARTRLKLAQSADDGFGKALLSQLHESGYAIDYSDKSIGNTVFPESSSGVAYPNSTTVSHQEPTKSLDSVKPQTTGFETMSYLVDQIGKDFFRVTVRVEKQTLSRVYTLSNNSLVPAGAWVRKE